MLLLFLSGNRTWESCGSVMSHSIQSFPSRGSGGRPVKMWELTLVMLSDMVVEGSAAVVVPNAFSDLGNVYLFPPPSRATSGSRGRILNISVWYLRDSGVVRGSWPNRTIASLHGPARKIYPVYGIAWRRALRCSAVFNWLRRALLVQAGLSAKRDWRTVMVSRRVLSNVSILGRSSLCFMGIDEASLSTMYVRILVACWVLTVVILPVVSMDCLTVGFCR